MGRIAYSADELLRRPAFPGIPDPAHVYYHFRPPRPVDLVVTRDPLSGELNVAAGTYGVLSEEPLTICLHSAKRSFDTTRNTLKLGAECVVALPTRDQVRETWYTALPIPRGICEADIAGFTMSPSRYVSVPGIAECPVNLECRIELIKEWFTHWILFLRVVGASIDDGLCEADRQAIIRRVPTYEVDDQTNSFGGSIERLGVNGDLLSCPGFPVGARRGAGARTEEWIADLQVAHRLSAVEAEIIGGWLRSWRQSDVRGDLRRMEKLRQPLTRALELAAWEEWGELRAHIVKNAELVYG